MTGNTFSHDYRAPPWVRSIVLRRSLLAADSIFEPVGQCFGKFLHVAASRASLMSSDNEA